MIENSKDARDLSRNLRENRMVLYTGAGESVSLEGFFIGQPLVLICGGPSLRDEDLAALRSSGVMTMGLNNSWGVYRPDIWVSADPSSRFLDSGWRDPRILKLCPLSEATTRLRRKTPNGFSPIALKPCTAPRTLFYKRGVSFNPDTFLDQPVPSLGSRSRCLDLSGVQGSRSVMLIALRMAHYLGFRSVGIIGADFSMPEDGEHYAAGEKHGPSIARGNQNTYEGLNHRFARMAEHFKSRDFHVINCTQGSRLDAFDRMSLEKFLSVVPKNPGPEGQDSTGWYDNHNPQRSTELDYHILRDGAPYTKWHQRIYTAAVSLMRSENSSVLDVGCGLAVGLKKMREAGMKGQWTGIDCEVPENLVDGEESANVFIGAFEDVSPDLEPYDHVWCVEVLEHLVGDPSHFLRELRRLTKKSAIISTPDSSKSDHGTKTSFEWGCLLRDAGFSVTRLEVGASCVFVCEPTEVD